MGVVVSYYGKRRVMWTSVGAGTLPHGHPHPGVAESRCQDTKADATGRGFVRVWIGLFVVACSLMGVGVDRYVWKKGKEGKDQARVCGRQSRIGKESAKRAPLP